MAGKVELIKGESEFPVVVGSLDFIDKTWFETDKPYTIAGPLPAEHEQHRTNLVTAPCQVSIRDIRGHEDALNIDTDGVEVLKRKSVVALAEIDDDTVHAYLTDLSDWLLERLAVQHCFCYAYKFRSSRRDERPAGTYSGTRGIPDEPAPLVHIDHTKGGGPRRIRRHLTSKEQAELLQENIRLRIVTLWRPINGTVEEYPLTFCDPFSVSETEDLIPGDRISSNHIGEVYYVAHNNAQRWYWMSKQSSEECIMFNSYDSHRGIGPAFTPHGTFKLGGEDGIQMPRESLEARFILVG